MALFSKSIYKVQVEIRNNFNQLHPHICLFNTGAGLDMVSKTFLSRELSTRIRNQPVQKLRSAVKEPVRLLSNILFFVRISDTHVEAWFGIVKRLAVDVHLGMPFVNLLIRGIFPGESRFVPWHSDPVTILTRQVVKSEQLVSHLKPSNIAIAPYKAIVQISMQVALQPYTKMRVNATTLVSGRSLLEPAQLAQQYSHLHGALGIIYTFKDPTFGIFINNFGSAMQLLPERMVVANAVVEPAVIANLPYKQASRTLQEDSNLACTTLTVVAVHYKPTGGQEVQMARHKIVAPKVSLFLAQDWQH